MFTRAVKTDAKLRLALAGPPGSGKSYTAPSLAHALADRQGVALIDTEHGSASKYADLFPPFDCLNLETFHPDLYVEAIKAAERAGYGVLLIDSLSHAWKRDGVDYEFDVVGDLDTENTLTIQKSRCPGLSGAIIPRPGPDLATILPSWLSGTPPADVERAALAAQITYLRAALGEAAPDVAGMEQATEEQLRKERTRLTTKHADAVC